MRYLLAIYIIRRTTDSDKYSYFDGEKFYATTLNAKRFSHPDDALECLSNLTDEVRCDKKNTSYFFSIEKHYHLV